MDRHEDHAGGVGGRGALLDRRARGADGVDGSSKLCERAALRAGDTAGECQADCALAVAQPAPNVPGRARGAAERGGPHAYAPLLSPCTTAATAALAGAPPRPCLRACFRARRGSTAAARPHVRDLRSRSHLDRAGGAASGTRSPAGWRATRAARSGRPRLAGPPGALGPAPTAIAGRVDARQPQVVRRRLGGALLSKAPLQSRHPPSLARPTVLRRRFGSEEPVLAPPTAARRPHHRGKLPTSRPENSAENGADPFVLSEAPPQ
jgi:hypothetical protein